MGSLGSLGLPGAPWGSLRLPGASWGSVGLPEVSKKGKSKTRERSKEAATKKGAGDAKRSRNEKERAILIHIS